MITNINCISHHTINNDLEANNCKYRKKKRPYLHRFLFVYMQQLYKNWVYKFVVSSLFVSNQRNDKKRLQNKLKDLYR